MYRLFYQIFCFNLCVCGGGLLFVHLLVLETEFPYVAQAEIIGTPSSGKNSYSTTPTGILKMTNSELSLNVTVTAVSEDSRGYDVS